MEDEKIITIYTDGSCIPNPGKGGWAYVILYNDEQIINSGYNENSTNNIMELTAVINALNYVQKNISIQEKNSKIKIILYTDSQYVKNGITEWINKWKINNWKTGNKKKVKNIELWLQLDNFNSIFYINWNWIHGHASLKYNELCDTLAKEEIKKNNS